MSKAHVMRLVRSRQRTKTEAKEQKAIIKARATDLMEQSARLRSMSSILGGGMPGWAREAIARNDAKIQELLS